LVNVSEKDGWIRIKSDDLNFFGKYNISPENAFKVAFSDGHYVKDATGMRWMDGKVILLQGDKVVWVKEISRPHNARVASNGNVIVFDSIYKPPDHRLGSSLLVFDSNGDVVLQRQFEFNLNDCNITSDGRICFVTTLAPDDTIYRIEVSNGQIVWKVKDKRASKGIMKIDDKRQVLEVTDRHGLGLLRVLDFSGTPIAGEPEEAITKLTTIRADVNSMGTALELLNSPNTATVLSTVEKLDSVLSRLKPSVSDSTVLVPALKRLQASQDQRIANKAFSCLMKIARTSEAARKDIISFLLEGAGSMPMDEHSLYRLSRVADLDADSVSHVVPRVLECLMQSGKWNDRRWAAIVIGQIGRKRPDLIKDAIPVLTWYMAHSDVLKGQPRDIPLNGSKIVISNEVLQDAARALWLKVEAGIWLMDACIDAIGSIASADPKLVSTAFGLLKEIASSAQSEYSRKKAEKALSFFIK
jgi:hypothetical protein